MNPPISVTTDAMCTHRNNTPSTGRTPGSIIRVYDYDSRDPAMIHEILPVGMLRCNCSIFGDEISGEAVVVDPGDEIERITAVLERHNLRVTAIVITHAHIDHIGGAQKLKA